MGLPAAQIPLASTLLARTALALVPRVGLLARPARVRVRVGVLPRVWAVVVVVVVVVGVVCGRRGWWWGRFVRWPKSWR
ncbi:hypothetical protein [Microbispora hainanensis]|uniref:hypothetical protein n=1 Tax=Microbispora hainanensis TaxID=568844 RepID=UPI0033D0CFDA